MRLFVLVASLALAAGGAVAHPDVEVVDRVVRLEPGAAATFPMAIHYHRLVGHVRVAQNTISETGSLEPVGAADGVASGAADRTATRAASGFPSALDRLYDATPTVTLLVLDEAAHLRSGEAALPEEAALAIEGAPDATVNHLLRCCDENVYSDYFLVVRNDGAEPIDVDLRMWNVHDDFAVVVDRAETGAFTIPLGIFLALAIAAGRAVRRERAGVRNSSAFAGTQTTLAPSLGDQRLPLSFWLSLGLAAFACFVALSLAAFGASRYPAGLVDGMVAAMADLPVPAGPFGSRDALVMGVLLLAWSGAVACWVRSVSVGAARASRWPAALAIGIGIVTLIGGALMGWTYRSPVVPGTLGLVLGIPLIAAGLALLRPMKVQPPGSSAST